MMETKTTHPLRAKLESVALVWYIILNLIGMAFVYHFQNWPMCVAIFILSHFVIGFCEVEAFAGETAKNGADQRMVRASAGAVQRRMGR